MAITNFLPVTVMLNEIHPFVMGGMIKLHSQLPMGKKSQLHFSTQRTHLSAKIICLYKYFDFIDF